jgi:hypothetical protein
MIKLNPRFYVESQGAFATRFAVRINTDCIDSAAFDRNETAAWDTDELPSGTNRSVKSCAGLAALPSPLPAPRRATSR